MKAGRGVRWIAFLAGVAAALLCLYVWSWAANAFSNRLQRQFSVDAEQIKAIAEAIGEYEAEHGERPEMLGKLPGAGDICYDRRRTEKSGPEDVLYIPAVRSDDPGDLVMLCTLLLPDEDAPFLVIYNDGTFDELAAVDLVTALNRTYRHVCNDIVRQTGSGRSQSPVESP
jgi:hypothetical protein